MATPSPLRIDPKPKEAPAATVVAGGGFVFVRPFVFCQTLGGFLSDLLFFVRPFVFCQTFCFFCQTFLKKGPTPQKLSQKCFIKKTGVSVPRSIAFHCMGNLGAPHPFICSRKRFGTTTQNAHEVSLERGVGHLIVFCRGDHWSSDQPGAFWGRVLHAFFYSKSSPRKLPKGLTNGSNKNARPLF